METRVKMWGNSLALRIPKPIAAEIGLDDNSPVEVVVIDGKLVVARTTEPEYNLDELLAQITEENLHREIDTGPLVGNELW
ncbi:MAG: AbrB/MazE/SpoVT family DNA-binding domain-containing protein [Anaerolineae bacterium]|nr:AbrB/MazE/SpoVT family DNA-binding domain-containing protein [Anaerolineae bacterium]